MTICYLALGSNLKYPERQLRQAIQCLRKTPRLNVIKVAPFYCSRALGRKSQPAFYNTVIAVTTSLTALQLLTCCKKIEEQQGRQRRLRWGARTLDIDIVLYGQQIWQHVDLIIPHPRLLERDFVIYPLLAVAPHARLPTGELVALAYQVNEPTLKRRIII